MNHALKLYNSLTREKELFQPLRPGEAGIYVCGPTVYGETHLGHARPYITFDVLWRYLKHLGYKVRYVRNITDVGHLEHDADEGADKIAKKALAERLEPMEVAERYKISFHESMRHLNVLPPSVEPLATGHIIEQIGLIEKIMKQGYAYEVNGSVYFDVLKYNEDHPYGILSGRKIEDLQPSTRKLESQEEKHNRVDFALWKKAAPEHIMRWPSPWSDGFPGWHIECSAMSAKYLGETFDIHGGGMDLLFPHHECEIAQSVAGTGHSPARYWVHCNMITLNGQKMGKSLGNAISLNQFFTGDHPKLEQAYTPMTIRFFILQAHYRSTLDFTNEALKAAEKGMSRLFQGMHLLQNIKPSGESTLDINAWERECYAALNDDLNTAILISKLFEAVSWIYALSEKKEKISEADLEKFKDLLLLFTKGILGLEEERKTGGMAEALIEMVIAQRTEARAKKDFATSDMIRNKLMELGIALEDGKEGTTWMYV
jgi:cysteinyl-tRNA synthetase